MPRTSSQRDVLSPATAAPTVPMPSQRRFGSNALIALLCGLVVALAVGIVFAVRGPSTKSAAAADRPVPPAAPTQPASTDVLAPTPTPPLPSVSAPAAVKAEEPKPEPIDLQLQTPPPPKPAAAPPPVRTPNTNVRTVRQQPPARPAPQPTKPSVKQPASPAATTTTATPPTATEKPAADCNPPYYYDGAKKIFKPACI